MIEICEICKKEFDIEEEGGIKSNITGRAVCPPCMRENPKKAGKIIASK